MVGRERRGGGAAHRQTGDRVVVAPHAEVVRQVVRQLAGQERLVLVLQQVAAQVDGPLPVGVEGHLAADGHDQGDVVLQEDALRLGVVGPRVPVVTRPQSVEQIETGVAAEARGLDLHLDVPVHRRGPHVAELDPGRDGIPLAARPQPMAETDRVLVAAGGPERGGGRRRGSRAGGPETGRGTLLGRLGAGQCRGADEEPCGRRQSGEPGGEPAPEGGVGHSLVPLFVPGARRASVTFIGPAPPGKDRNCDIEVIDTVAHFGTGVTGRGPIRPLTVTVSRQQRAPPYRVP